MLNKVPYSIKYIFAVFVLGIIFFAFYRALFLIYNHSLLNDVPTLTVLKIFLIGLRFDIVIISYITILLFPLFLIYLIFNKQLSNPGLLLKLIHILSCVLFTLSFLIFATHIPFYQYYHIPLNKAVLHWSNDLYFSIKMIFQDKSLLIHVLIFVVTTSFLILIFNRIKHFLMKNENVLPSKELIFLLIILPFIILGMRGRISYKSPIQWGASVHSNNEIANQAALNPIFTFFKSISTNTHQAYLELNKAETICNENISLKNYVSPNDTVLLEKYNVIIVLMESMGINKTGLENPQQSLSPYLDKLAKQALFFNTCYSDGIHTFNALFSLITSFPSLPLNKPLDDFRIRISPNNFIQKLKEKSYQTFFFTTHDSQFDNMEGFMKRSGIDKIIDVSNFSNHEVLSATGVPDHVLYDKCISVFDIVSTPFFAVILSGSDHAPFAIPQNIHFKPQHKDKRKNIVAYADWSIGNFLKHAQQKKWFNKTLFVFLGDHGAIIDHQRDVYLEMHHIPLIFYAPNKIIPETRTDLCGQTDILPSIGHLLKIPFNNKPFSINLFNEKRKALSFTYDEQLIGINDSAFFVSRQYNSNLFLKNKEKKYCPVLSDSLLAKNLNNYSLAIMELARRKLFEEQ